MEAFFATAPRGLETLLLQELVALGAQDAKKVPGGVAFSGGWEACYRANLWSRIASRVLWRVSEFPYGGEEDLYGNARAVDWPRMFRPERTLRVNVAAHKSPLKSLEFATLRIKDAICDRFRDDTGVRPSVNRAKPDVRVHAFLDDKRGALYLDTSGEPLFKRGWRAAAVEAPLRENLAAGILGLAGWTPQQALLDPMCGGATLLVEAAAIARGRAPGLRRGFGFEKLAAHNPKLWQKLKDEAARPAKQLAATRLYGSDSDPRALAVARRSLAEAGVERWVKLELADVLTRRAPEASGVLVANPPYGERIGSQEELALFYPQLGDALKKHFSGWNCHILTADLRLPRLIRLDPSRRTPLFNGALECRLYEFRIVAGSNRVSRSRSPA